MNVTVVMDGGVVTGDGSGCADNGDVVHDEGDSVNQRWR